MGKVVGGVTNFPYKNTGKTRVEQNNWNYFLIFLLRFEKFCNQRYLNRFSKTN